MAKYQFMGPGTTGFSSASSYVTMSAALQLVASACRKKCVKLYLKESVRPPCTIHSLNSVNERVSVRLFDGEFHWGKVFDEAVTSLPTKFDRHLWLYQKEKTSQQPLVGVLRGVCSQFLQEELMDLWDHNWAQVYLWVCIILSWSCKEMEGKVIWYLQRHSLKSSQDFT